MPDAVSYNENNKAIYALQGHHPYLIGLVDSRNNWYTFDTHKGLVPATNGQIEDIKSFGDEFETVNDDNGDVYAAVLSDDGTKIIVRHLLIFKSDNGIKYKFNRYADLIELKLVELPDQSKPRSAFFNVDLRRMDR